MAMSHYMPLESCFIENSSPVFFDILFLILILLTISFKLQHIDLINKFKRNLTTRNIEMFYITFYNDSLEFVYEETFSI